jgi:hypothetical protein
MHNAVTLRPKQAIMKLAQSQAESLFCGVQIIGHEVS